jgi:hypothetical protein
MTKTEQNVIEKFAAGDKSLRDTAIMVYHKYVREWALCCRKNNPYMDFMSEIDNPCPDLGLRAMYRRKITSEVSNGSTNNT